MKHPDKHHISKASRFMLMALVLARSFVGMVIAGIILLIVLPVIVVFEARYLTRVYECAGTA